MSDTPYADLCNETADTLEAAHDKVDEALKVGKELKAWVKEEIAVIENNDVYKQPAAIIQINAPVALIQVELASRRRALKEVLEKLT
jgi:hypothetical protein